MTMPRTTERLTPIHPGEFLREDFLRPFDLSSSKLAIALRIPATRILEIVHERRGITADTALRLGRYFGTTAEFWMNMQQQYELAMAEKAAADKLNEVARRSA